MEQSILPSPITTNGQAQMVFHTTIKTVTPPYSGARSQHEHVLSSGIFTKAPYTPPESVSGSPNLQLHSSLPPSSAQVALPSFSEFVQLVKDLARHDNIGAHKQYPFLLSTRSPNLSSSLPQMGRPVESYTAQVELGFSGPLHRRDESTQEAFQASSPSAHGSHAYGMIDYHYSSPDHPSLSPSPEPRRSRNNKKYTTEQCDFIIYMCHDRRQKWPVVESLFAAQFGITPYRTTQGLQACYYRLNLTIPVWDKDGRLVFENEDTLGPKTFAQKCRLRQALKDHNRPMGLAQRYPERAVEYPWVDIRTKAICQDWAMKRQKQFEDRRQRRMVKKLARDESLGCIPTPIDVAYEYQRSG